MTSVNPNERADGPDVRRSASGRVPGTGPGYDPVHPSPSAAPRPKPAATATAEPGASRAAAASDTAAAAPAAPAAESNARESAADGESAESRVASELGTAAVLDHHVVAIELRTGDKPFIIRGADRDQRMMPLEVQVWARAGRMTVVTADGGELKVTVLAPEEYEGVRVGDHWPRGEHDSDSRAKRIAGAALREAGDVITFPAWLARTTRISGARNAALHGLVRKLREASPTTAVYYGATFGFEHTRPEHHRPYDHRGIVGKEGYPTEL